MSENAVVFKGTKEGLYILIKEDMDLDKIKYNLNDKIKPSKRFFEGAKIVNFKGKKLTKEEFEELKELVENDYGMLVLGEYTQDSDMLTDKEDAKEHMNYEKLPYDNVVQDKVLMLRATVRSGQLIEFIGNIVIIGDVNPGAQIKATGSIVIMGTMRGVAHAGSNGDYGAYVAALNLLPAQIRIGDIITRSPDGLGVRTSVPEMAVVKRGMIFVEPYLPNR
ncbi:MAG: septum site-determining protein MinC [Clostridiales bacterium GWB2_37_7]|nr:MAG: septum site-determining protein MinC [Clostridiales bacterium GWB2_37_7]